MTPNVLIIHLLTEPEDVLQLEADWNRLWNSGGRREVFTSFAWAKAYIRTYAERNSMRVVVARRAERVSAILPLVFEDGELRFVGMPHSDYCDLLCDEATTVAELRSMLAALSDSGLPWRACRFNNLSEHSRLLALCREADFQLGFAHSLHAAHKCPAVRAGGDAARVFGELLRKENPKRCEKRLKERGALEFAHLESREEILACLDAFFDQHRLRRAVVGGGGGMFSRAERRIFFRRVVEEFDPRDALRFAVLRMDGRPVAYHFGFELDRRYIWYVPTFDIDYWDDRPGLVLLRRLFEYAMNRNLDELDFTIGDEEYKTRFANHVGQNVDLILYPPGAKGYAARSRDRIRRYVRSGRAPARAIAKGLDVQRRWRKHGFIRGILAAARSVRRGLFPGRPLLVFSPPPAAGAAPAGAESASLSDIVRCWMDDSTATNPKIALARFRRGHKALVSRVDGRIVRVVWVAPMSDARAAADFFSQQPSVQPGPVAYDPWSANDVPPDDMRALLLSAGDGRAGYACCPEDHAAARRMIEAAGYRLAFRARAIPENTRPAPSHDRTS